MEKGDSIVDNHRSEFAVKKMYKALNVYESGYYLWKNRKKTSREIEDEGLVLVIREIHDVSKKTYGAGRIYKALEDKGIMISVGRIRRLMRQNGIYSITRYKHRPYPKEKVETRYTENVINREFQVGKPDKAWCGDITYIRTETGWVYLAAVIDLFNREVVGYSMYN